MTAFFKVPYFKTKSPQMPETTWMLLKVCTSCLSSASCLQRSEQLMTSVWRRCQLTTSLLLLQPSETSWRSTCSPWPTICLTATLLTWVEVRVSACDKLHSGTTWHLPPNGLLQSQSSPPECLVRCSGLLTGVLAGYISIGFLSEEEACCSQLFTKAKVDAYPNSCLSSLLCIRRVYVLP